MKKLHRSDLFLEPSQEQVAPTELVCLGGLLLQTGRPSRATYSGGGGNVSRFNPQARHVALPREAEADGSAVVEVWGAAEPPGGALRGGATQRVP